MTDTQNSSPESEQSTRLAEWSEWRGGVTQRITSLETGIYARLSDLDNNFNRRMDRQDDQISLTLEQAKLTNGRVTKSEIEIAEIVAEKVGTANEKRAHFERLKLTSSLLVAALAAFIGAAATILTKLLY